MSAEHCSRCGDRAGHEPLAEAQCALWAAILADVRTYAAKLDQPPGDAYLTDLLAHLKVRYGDVSRAHAAAVLVLDLGWRPTVGVR